MLDARRFNQQINEDCFYFTKFFMKDDHQLRRSQINSNQTEILFDLKSAKTKICSSLLM